MRRNSRKRSESILEEVASDEDEPATTGRFTLHYEITPPGSPRIADPEGSPDVLADGPVDTWEFANTRNATPPSPDIGKDESEKEEEDLRDTYGVESGLFYGGGAGELVGAKLVRSQLDEALNRVKESNLMTFHSLSNVLGCKSSYFLLMIQSHQKSYARPNRI